MKSSKDKNKKRTTVGGYGTILVKGDGGLEKSSCSDGAEKLWVS